MDNKNKLKLEMRQGGRGRGRSCLKEESDKYLRQVGRPGYSQKQGRRRPQTQGGWIAPHGCPYRYRRIDQVTVQIDPATLWPKTPTSKPRTTFWNKTGAHIVLLFEFALGYALFDARGVNQLPDLYTFEVPEKYLNSSDDIFTLIAFYPFSSPADALVQMNAISNSTVTKELKSFLVDNLPKPILGNPGYEIATCDPFLGSNILYTTKISHIGGVLFNNIMRGLRMNIDKFIDGLKPGDLKKAQLNLARCYRTQSCACKESSMTVSSTSSQEVVVVPHRFEGLFITKGRGKDDFICTKNLVRGEALYGDELISVQNEDRTEVEYRIWNLHKSKLAAAILCGLTNLWVKPGSRVLYLGDVCGITVLQLSDLVGSDGLVYVVGLCDDVADTVEERSNVITIFGSGCYHVKYRMVIGMVDVILADSVYPCEARFLAIIASFYLKTGGHYMISTRPKDNINLTSQVKDLFDDVHAHGMRREFKLNELVMLDPIEIGHSMAVGGFRMVEE